MTPILELAGVSKAFGALRPLRIESLALASGDAVAVVGLDAAAAEVLVNLVMGATLPDAGRVVAFGRPTSAIADSTEWLALVDRFGVVGQRVVLLDAFSALQNLAVPFSLAIEPPHEDVRRQAAALAREVELPERLWETPVGQLAPADRVRLQLGRALAHGPEVLLVEHATAAVPAVAQADLGQLIRYCCITAGNCYPRADFRRGVCGSGRPARFPLRSTVWAPERRQPLAPLPESSNLMGHPTLVLFDVDGTLLLTGGAGARALTRAFEELFGVADAFQNAQLAGRTDHAILSDALRVHAVEPDPVAVARFPEVYASHLQDEIQKPGHRKGVMPGVPAVLDVLAGRPGVRLALLTGNYREGARIKLEYFRLWRYFSGGAFGDDAPDRNSLLPLAMRQAIEDGMPDLDVANVVVIGDTPLDIACAAAGEARCIAVATGSYDREALRLAGGEIVLPDLTDTAAVLCALGC